MKFALVTQDSAHAVQFCINPEVGDATSFLNWIDVWKGFHFSFDKLRHDMSILKTFDVVMMSGNPYNFRDIVQICKFLRDSQTITMFYPEGSVQLYDNSINGFHKEIYDAWNACDVLSIAEEDKLSYYGAFIRSETIVRFVHVPLRWEMEMGQFWMPLSYKKKNVSLVYGDNNPNHPLVAIAAAARCGLSVVGVDIDRGKAKAIEELFPSVQFEHYTKLSQYAYLRILGMCFVNFYPTEWIGTARQQIACAVSGTPCIGNHDSHTQRRLFPDLGCDIYDIDRMQELYEKIFHPREYQRVALYAREAVKFYGLEMTKRRFVEAVDAARAIKCKVQVSV